MGAWGKDLRLISSTSLGLRGEALPRPWPWLLPELDGRGAVGDPRFESPGAGERVAAGDLDPTATAGTRPLTLPGLPELLLDGYEEGRRCCRVPVAADWRAGEGEEVLPANTLRPAAAALLPALLLYTADPP